LLASWCPRLLLLLLILNVFGSRTAAKVLLILGVALVVYLKLSHFNCVFLHFLLDALATFRYLDTRGVGLQQRDFVIICGGAFITCLCSIDTFLMHLSEFICVDLLGAEFLIVLGVLT
jgi:hypothetical protein